MEVQYGIILVLVVAMISVFIVISARTTKSSRAALDVDAPRQAEHDEQTRIMAKRLADTGTEWRIAQEDVNGEPDNDEPVDQSVEAQAGRLDQW